MDGALPSAPPISFSHKKGAKSNEPGQRLKEFEVNVNDKRFSIRSSTIVLSAQYAAVTFNDGIDIHVARAQQVLDTLNEVLKPHSWGTDFSLQEKERDKPPAVYFPKYKFSIPYDPKIGNGVK